MREIEGKETYIQKDRQRQTEREGQADIQIDEKTGTH